MRQLVRRGKEVKYYFFAQIISGFEIAPHILEETLKTKVEVQIGNTEKETPTIQTKEGLGRFPMWLMASKPILVSMDSNLGFVSDIRIVLLRVETSYFSGAKSSLLGLFIVPITSVTTLYNYPQYYSFVDEKGNLVGKVLARFYIIKKS